jgi:hypothetical protein
MKKLFLSLLFLSPFLLPAQTVKSLKKTITLKMPKTADDDMPGTRGASVVWHPVQKKYYAAMAGNVAYPIAVFDAAGKRLSDDDVECQVDVRGLWYNAKTKKLSGNGYGETGWFSYSLDENGIPYEAEVLYEGQNQPGDQSVGSYNTAKNMVYFLSGQQVKVYNNMAEEVTDSTVRFYAGVAKKADINEDDDKTYLNEDDYNQTTLIYTGIPKAEFGILNIMENQVELYDRKSGLLTRVLKFPEDATTEASFNFAYTNGTYWLFNMETRIWTGYK